MDILIRATIIFWALYVLVRLLGKRELAQLTPFELIVLIATGDLIQQGVTQSDYSFTGLVLAGGMFAFLSLAVSYLGFRVPRLRRLLDPPPLVVVEDGRVIERNLRRERMTVDEIRAEARQQQIASLADVRWAVLESNGRISFIPKEKG